MKNNTLLLILLILALVGDVILAWKLYECMEKDGETILPVSTCTSELMVNGKTVVDEWNNFNTLNNDSAENWGVVCKDVFLKMFSDTSVNAVSFYLGADGNDPTLKHLYSVGVVGSKVIPGSEPGSGVVITSSTAVYYHCSPWCPPNCYTRR